MDRFFNNSNNNMISSDELKEILLDILLSIDDYCRKENIEYYLAGGTLLGAVRHKGFIPWDDDIDICMPRKAYLYFVKHYKSNRYVVCTCNNRDDYCYPFAKVIDTKTTLIERNSKKLTSLGAFVDIFPLDYCGSDFNHAKHFYYFSIKPLRIMAGIKNVSLYNNGHNLLINTLILFGKLLLYPISLNKIIRKIDSIAQKYDNDNESTYIAVISVMVYGINEIMRSDWYGKPTSVTFEGFDFFAPNNYDSILHNLYGDYLKLPPIDEQKSKHEFDVFWNTCNKSVD